jgi:hypothetical protein
MAASDTKAQENGDEAKHSFAAHKPRTGYDLFASNQQRGAQRCSKARPE